MRKRQKGKATMVDAVDLFCGGGGLTCGLRLAGINVKMGVEIDEQCQYAYEHNNKAKFLCKSVVDLKGSDIRAHYNAGHVSLLAGCPPCQTFSKYNQKASHTDQRWNLLGQFRWLVGEVGSELEAMRYIRN